MASAGLYSGSVGRPGAMAVSATASSRAGPPVVGPWIKNSGPLSNCASPGGNAPARLSGVPTRQGATGC